MRKPKITNTIRSRIALSFLGLILIPTIFYGVFITGYYKSSLIEATTSNAEATVKFINQNLTRQFQEYFYLADAIQKDKQLRELYEVTDLKQFSDNKEKVYRLKRLFNSYRSANRDIFAAALLYNNGNFFSSISTEMQAIDYTQEEWYKRCLVSVNEPYVFHNPSGDEPFSYPVPNLAETISVCTAIMDKDRGSIGIVVLLLYSQSMEKSVKNVLAQEGSPVYITNKQDELIYSPILEDIPNEQQGNDVIIVKSHNSDMGWDIVHEVSIKEIYQQIHMLQRWGIISIMLLTVLFLTSLLAIQSSVIKPIHRLRRSMKEVARGDLNARFQPAGSMEIVELGNSFNRMLNQINELIQQEEQARVAKQKAEILALQANINPHFLYNTLDTISWMAKENDKDNVIIAIQSLSRLLRVMLSKGKEVIPLQQEMIHLNSYLQIQKYRYEDMLDYSVEVDASCNALLVQKMILQPLVENAIYHGIKECDHQGFISIKVWRSEQSLYLQVEDNGIGMTPERLEQVKQSLDLVYDTGDSDAYGVINVHQKIVLSYGMQYGLQFASRYGEGTTVLIKHPIL